MFNYQNKEIKSKSETQLLKVASLKALEQELACDETLHLLFESEEFSAQMASSSITVLV
jgi:hypothetical protein